MAQNQPEKEPKAPTSPEKDIVKEVYEGQKESGERREALSEDEQRRKDLLEKELAKIQEVPEITREAKRLSKTLPVQDRRQTLQKLLDIAKTQGVGLAVKTAQELNDAFILDALHDTLIKEGFSEDTLS